MPITDTARPDVACLDPCAFLAVLGKRVVQPGGRRVLDIGCGVATTAIEVTRRYATTVAAADISPLMLTRARAACRVRGRGNRPAGPGCGQC